jgi:hypothetical protein
MTHGEKMARAALAKWLNVYTKQLGCEECIGPKDSRCHKHQPEVVKLIKDTKMLLSTGPN